MNASPAPAAFAVTNQDSKGGPYELRQCATRQDARTVLLAEAGFMCQAFGGSSDWVASLLLFVSDESGHDLVRLVHRTGSGRWIEFRVVPS